MVSGGHKSASKKGLDVDLWWSKTPDANVGIATGLVSGIVVVDVDYKSGGIYSDPNTVRTKTGGGGMHVFYRTNDTAARSRIKFRQGLDIRADGGYIVAPPSVHRSGSSYEWVDENGPLADMPDWLMLECAPLDYAQAHPEPHATDPDAFRRARSYLEKTPPTVCGIGECHLRTFLAAQNMVRGFNLSDDESFQLITEWTSRSTHKWTSKELRYKIAEARRVGRQTPGSKLVRRATGQSPKLVLKSAKPERKPTPLPAIEPEKPAPVMQEVATASPPSTHGLDCPGLHAEAEIPVDWVVQPYNTKDVSVVFMDWQKRKDSNGDTYMVQVPVAVSHTPMVVLARSIDVSTNDVRLQVGIEYSTGWERRFVPALALRSSTELVKQLGGFGADVHSNNARHLINYFSGYERANAERIQNIKTSGQCGHHGKGFLLGTKAIGQTDLGFLGDDGGDDNRAKRVKSSGSFEKWLQAIRVLDLYPVAKMAMLASLAAPLLKPLSAQNFVVDVANDTSTGKTTFGQIASSVWGNPQNNEEDSYSLSWDATQVGIERTAGIMCDLPLVMDESKRVIVVKGVNVVGSVVYAYCNGEGRARGSISGMRDVRHWRGVMLSTGNERLVDMCKDGGIAARVISIWAKPFGEKSLAAAESIDNLKGVLWKNYGHAGEHFVHFILANRDNWTKWQEDHRELAVSYAKDLAGVDVGIAQRLASYLATLQMAGLLFYESIGKPGSYVSPIQAVIDIIAPDAKKDANKPAAALRYVYEWCVRNQHRFDGQSSALKSGELVGRWREQWSSIAILPSVLSEILQHGGFDPEAMRRQFAEAGYLRMFEGGGVSSGTARIQRKPVKCVFLLREAIKAL